MRWTHRSEHRMEASTDLCRTLVAGIYLIPHPRPDQLHVSHISSDPSDPNGDLDQIKSILKKKQNQLIEQPQSIEQTERRSRRSYQLLSLLNTF